MTIVTRESIQEMLNNSNEQYRIQVIGRALVALFNRQTEGEKANNTTNNDNSIGFSGADAMSGTLTAKYFLKHKTLLNWQVEKWTKPAKNGFARLCKYAKQLDEIAQEKEQAKAA